MLTTTFLILSAIVASSIRIVPEKSTRIIETFGRYSKTLHSGIHFIIPLVQRVAKAYSVDIIRNAINQEGGHNAVSLDVAQQYVKAFSHLAKTNNTILLPTDISNPSAMVASAMSIYKKVSED